MLDSAPPPSRGGEPTPLWAWLALPVPRFEGGHRVRLHQGGDDLFPAMRIAIDAARSEVWLAAYIFHDDDAGQGIATALRAAASRGVAVHVLVDGFGSLASLPRLQSWFCAERIVLDVFRPLDRWYAWLQPSQLRRMHHKLCVVDTQVAFVGGINILDDRHDLVHGRAELPRLDFAVELAGPAVARVRDTVRALCLRSRLGEVWRDEVRALTQGRRADGLALLLHGSGPPPAPSGGQPLPPVEVAFVARDNLRHRRAIERSYIVAIRGARQRVDIACPYFYPRRAFQRALVAAARRGVRVRLLLQGKVDYRLAALAARVLYDELLSQGVHIHEYTPAFLHAKVAVVDSDWATVGSSNIDPLSLLLNLEANVMVRDPGFSAQLGARFEQALAQSSEITATPQRGGWRNRLSRTLVSWCANLYLRVAGITRRY